MKSFAKKTSNRTIGFTLVEIMVVVAIIAILAAMGIPAFNKSRLNSMASRIANDYRSFAGAFQTIALEEGTWPEDTSGNELPPSAEAYIKKGDWTAGVVKGSYWDWEGPGRHGLTASINFVDKSQNLEAGLMQRVDEMIDDGNLGSGTLRKVTAGEFIYILEI